MVLNFSSLFQNGDKSFFFFFLFDLASDGLRLFGALFKGLKSYTRVLMVLPAMRVFTQKQCM